jgi:hypothetical protein
MNFSYMLVYTNYAKDECVAYYDTYTEVIEAQERHGGTIYFYNSEGKWQLLD